MAFGAWQLQHGGSHSMVSGTVTSRSPLTPVLPNISIIVILMAVTFTTRALFRYHGGMGDPDQVVMAAGMARWFSPDVRFGDIFLYGRQLNPGIYFVFRLLYPLLFDTPLHVMAFLNWFGVASAALLAWPLYLVFGKYFDRGIAAGCTLLVVFSPLVWELGTYFHPVMTATFFFLLAVLTWERISLSGAGILFYVLTLLLSAAAVIMRTEVLLVVPALFVWTAFSSRRKRDVFLLCSLLIFVAGIYLAVLLSVASATTVTFRGLPEYLRSFTEMYRGTVSVAGVSRTIVWAAMGVGIATVLLAVIGPWRSFLRSSREGIPTSGKSLRGFIVVLVWILPTLILWLLWPVPILRHYFLIVPAASWLVGDNILRRLRSVRATAVVITLVLCNLGVPEVLYRAYNATHPGSRKEPHGTFFYYHERVTEKISRNHRLQREIVALMDGGRPDKAPGLYPGALVPVDWESYGYLLYGMARTMRLEKLSETAPVQDLYLHRYSLGGIEIRLAFSSRFGTEAVRQVLLSEIEKAAGEGFAIYMPEELIRSGIISGINGFSFIKY